MTPATRRARFAPRRWRCESRRSPPTAAAARRGRWPGSSWPATPRARSAIGWRASALRDDHLPRVLLDDSVAQHVGEHHHVLIALVVGLDVAGPVHLDPR